MDTTILISVIIPVYNAEKFIRRAVDNVLAQMNDQVELILIDDGSKDLSGAICDEYCAKYPRISVIHQTNAGPCVARNAGIRSAAGEYLMFLDSDDYFAEDAIETVSKVIREHHPDCIDFGWNYINCIGQTIPNHHIVEKNVLHGNDVIRKVILPRLLHLQDEDRFFINEFACTKVFRRQIMVEHNVLFDEGRRLWEDRPLVCQFFKHCRSFYSIDRCLYYYVYTEGSLSQRFSPDFLRIIIITFRGYVRLFQDEFDFDTEYINNYWCHAIENMIGRFLEQKQNREFLREKVLLALRDDQVIHWYANRKPQNQFEETISALVQAGELETVLRLYQKKVNQKLRNKTLTDLVTRVKAMIKGTVCRIMGR